MRERLRTEPLAARTAPRGHDCSHTRHAFPLKVAGATWSLGSAERRRPCWGWASRLPGPVGWKLPRRQDACGTVRWGPGGARLFWPPDAHGPSLSTGRAGVENGEVWWAVPAAPHRCCGVSGSPLPEWDPRLHEAGAPSLSLATGWLTDAAWPVSRAVGTSGRDRAEGVGGGGGAGSGGAPAGAGADSASGTVGTGKPGPWCHH